MGITMCIAGVHLAAEPSSGAPGVDVARKPPAAPSAPAFTAAHLNDAADVLSLTSITVAVGGNNQSAKSIVFLPRKRLILCVAGDRVTLALCNELMNVSYH